MTIDLIVFDIDGVLTEGEAQPLDLDFLDRLAALNRAARRDLARPPITLCTGRPAPYVEIMVQAIDGHMPAIYENGCGLYIPDTYQFRPHPDLGSDIHMAAIKDRLKASLIREKQAYIQPGKEHSLTLFPLPPVETAHLEPLVAEALGSLQEEVALVYSVACLNLVPKGIDKGKGIEFLASQTGVPPANMLGVGDSDVDLPFLQKVGYRAAPANANQAARDLAHYVSPRRTSAGAADILDHFGLI